MCVYNRERKKGPSTKEKELLSGRKIKVSLFTECAHRDCNLFGFFFNRHFSSFFFEKGRKKTKKNFLFGALYSRLDGANGRGYWFKFCLSIVLAQDGLKITFKNGCFLLEKNTQIRLRQSKS